VKKLIILIAAAFILMGCASTTSVASKDLSTQPVCRQMPGCTNIGIHDHIVFNW